MSSGCPRASTSPGRALPGSTTTSSSARTTSPPTSPSVHECAREVVPGARVAYVDHDPIVVAHNDALLTTRDGVITVRADVRDPDAVLGHDALAACIDFGQPLAV